MEINSIYGSILPINSITNSESKLILDFNSPFDFFTFLKHLKTTQVSSEYNNLYLFYLKTWSNLKQNAKQKSDEIIKDYYLNLLKELTINYFTIEEKRFISQIDFNDEMDLDIVLPFYSRKLVEICDFFCKKREDLKFASIKNTFKGTETSLSRCIFETITDHLIIDDNLTLTNITNNFDIEIEELYDFYQDYLNLDPSYEYTGNNELRKKYYTANINDVTVDLFVNFELSVKNQLLDNLRTFLISFNKNFTVNYNVNQIDLNCKVGDKLYDFVTQRKDKATRQVQLTSDLLKKYIGADYHYITVGETTTDIVSGVLFEAENPSGNLLNRRFPSTATIEDDSDLRTLRKIGLLFTPEKNSILQFSVPEKTIKIDQSKLEPNKVYIYPDPSIYTNAEGKTQYDASAPLIYIEKFQKTTKNVTYGITQGDIKNNTYIQDFHGYKSKKQISQINYFGEKSTEYDFLNLYDKGVLYKFSRDIYGNLFGLFKKTHKQELSNLKTPPLSSSEEEQIFHGGPIKYRNEGFLPELVPPTSANWVYPNVWSSDYYYNVAIDSGIGRIYNGKIPERGTDLYTSKLVISGIDAHSDNYVLSSIQYRKIDGGYFVDFGKYNSEIKLKDDLVTFIHGQIKTPTLTASQIDNDTTHQGGYFLKKSYGSIYVRNTLGEIAPLSSAFALSFEKYNSLITSEIDNSILDFNIYGNIMWIKTANYLIFENIKYENLKFVYSNTVNNKFSYYKNLSAFCVSDPFIFETRPYIAFATVEILNSDSYEFSIIPQIYFVEKSNCSISKKFPFGGEDLTVYKNVKKENSNNEYYLQIKPKKINSVSFTYNSKNNKYCITAIIEDQNEMFYVFKTIFTFDGRLFTSQIPTLTYVQSPTIIKTLNFLGDYNEFSQFDNYSEILNGRVLLNNDFFDLNNLTNTVSGELVSEGEIKLYV